jgi:hypothetical protein
MKDLIKALQILSKYANDDRNPTTCSHDTLWICAGISPRHVSEADKDELEKLGFIDSGEDSFMSYRFGSC